MTDLLLLSLTALLTWGMWRAMETWGAMAACWLWGWGMYVARMMRSA